MNTNANKSPSFDGEIIHKGVKGRVKWYDEDKGYGFIERAGATDVFLHARELDRSKLMVEIHKDDELEFDIMSTPKGEKAANIKLLTP